MKPGGVLLFAVHRGVGDARVERFFDRDAARSFSLFERAQMRERAVAAGFVVAEAVERDPTTSNFPVGDCTFSRTVVDGRIGRALKAAAERLTVRPSG